MEGTFSTKNEADWKNKELEKCNEILPLKIWKHMEVEQIVPSEPSDQVEVAHKNQDEVKSEGLKPSMSSKIENDTAVEDKSLAESFKYQVYRCCFLFFCISAWLCCSDTSIYLKKTGCRVMSNTIVHFGYFILN